MLKPLLFFLLIISFPVLRGQSLEGTVQDSLKKPVPYCAVGLLNAKDSVVVKGNLTDEAGKFIFESLRPGNYLIKINHAGFRETWSSLIVLDSLANNQVTPIILKSNGINLKEVDIVEIKEPIQFKNGNVTVNIDGSPLAIGNSVYDLLSRLPGVSVDNENISIQGKGGTKIYIDDRPQQMAGAQLINFLKSMNASVIDKIEVINNPPAKYDAAGDAGIINIRTKKIKLVGFSGSVNLTYSQGFYENTNGGFSLNYKGRKFTFFSNVNGNQGIKHHITTFDKTVTYNGQATQLNQRIIDDYDNRNLIIDLGVDWYVNKKNIIGCKIQGMPGYGLNKDRGTILLSDNSLGYRQLQSEKYMPNNWFMLNYNLNAEHLFDTLGTKLKFSGDYYGPNFDDYKTSYKNSFTDSIGNQTALPQEFATTYNLDARIIIAKLDFEKKLSKTLNMEAGIKGTYMDFVTDYSLKRKDQLTDLYMTDSLFTNKFRYIEKVSAAYLTFNKELKKWNFSLGARAENTIMQTENTDAGRNYTRSYLNLFPVLSANYNRSKNHVFSLSYNKRIQRPDYGNLNPYRSFDDILNSSEGNANLRPAYSHNLHFNYALKSSIYNSLTYTRYQNPISGYSSQNNSTKETVWQVTNLDYFDVLRYSFFMRKNIKKWWVVSFNFGTYYVGYAGKINGQQYSLSAVPHYEWLNNMFMLPKNLKIEVTAYYWGPWLGIAYKYKARGAMSLAIKKSFLDSKLNCSIGISDLFFTEVFESTANFQDQAWHRFESHDTRRLNLSLSYNFGKIKIEKRDIGTEEEEKLKRK